MKCRYKRRKRDVLTAFRRITPDTLEYAFVIHHLCLQKLETAFQCLHCRLPEKHVLEAFRLQIIRSDFHLRRQNECPRFFGTPRRNIHHCRPNRGHPKARSWGGGIYYTRMVHNMNNEYTCGTVWVVILTEIHKIPTKHKPIPGVRSHKTLAECGLAGLNGRTSG